MLFRWLFFFLTAGIYAKKGARAYRKIILLKRVEHLAYDLEAEARADY